jgi:hypothetical protein
VDLPEADLVDLVAPEADLPEADLEVVVRPLRAAEALVVREHPVDAGQAAPEGSAAVAALTRLSIPRTVKFPTQWLLARNPTT